MTRDIQVTASLQTIENPAYLIPAGTYTLGLHRWTKTGKLVPILQNVIGAPDDPTRPRSYILIHPGTKEEHSKGCILIPPFEGGKGGLVIDALVTLIQHGLCKITIV